MRRACVGVRAGALDRVRRPPGGEHAEQNAERVDVGGGGQRLAAQLLGARPAGGQRARQAERGPLPLALVGLEDLGDAEVEQLHPAFAVDEDVAGLEVAVQHELAVREGDRGADLEEEAQARVEWQAVRVAPVVDPLAPRRARGPGRGRRRRSCRRRAGARSPGARGAPGSGARGARWRRRISEESSERTNLIATVRSKAPSARRARQTLPMPPRPISVSSRQGPMRSGGGGERMERLPNARARSSTGRSIGASSPAAATSSSSSRASAGSAPAIRSSAAARSLSGSASRASSSSRTRSQVGAPLTSGRAPGAARPARRSTRA